MFLPDCMREIARRAGMTQRDVSRALGKSDNYMGAMIAKGAKGSAGIGTTALVDIASICGHSLALVPDAKVDDSMLVIDPPERG